MPNGPCTASCSRHPLDKGMLTPLPRGWFAAASALEICIGLGSKWFTCMSLWISAFLPFSHSNMVPVASFQSRGNQLRNFRSHKYSRTNLIVYPVAFGPTLHLLSLEELQEPLQFNQRPCILFTSPTLLFWVLGGLAHLVTASMQNATNQGSLFLSHFKTCLAETANRKLSLCDFQTLSMWRISCERLVPGSPKINSLKIIYDIVRHFIV